MNKARNFGAAFLLLAGCNAGGGSLEQTSQSVSSKGGNNTPGFIKNAKDLGPVDPSTVITVTAWLKLKNESQLDALVAGQYKKGNASYHKWLSSSDVNAQFAPTANQMNAVQNWLNSHNLKTLSVEENNYFVKVQGTVGDVQKAFHVQIDNFKFNGQTYRANTSDPSVNDTSGNNIAAITGLDDYGFQPQIKKPVSPEGQAYAPRPLSASPKGVFFEGQCFQGTQAQSFSSPGVSASYSGNRYGADISNGDLGHLAPCGYSPSEVAGAYGMNGLWANGLDGRGQTIVIVDAYGSPTIAQDAALFSAVYGLPPVDLTVVKAPGLSNNKHGDGWDLETTLDVEWAHAMAPAAKIALVVATDRSSLDEAIHYAVVHHLGNTISNSWASIEGFGNPAQLGRVERILQLAAAQGIDVNFSSGDNGDELLNVGFQSVDYPGSSTFATSIGGTSLALDGNGGVLFETGWGNNLMRVADTVALGSPAMDPPLAAGFNGGAGGGSSLTFAKPAFQSALPGTMRQVPDIGMLADPFTGAEYIITDPTLGPVVDVVGGTSLACPLFSGVMAIAAQKAGHGLGQAAPLLYGIGSAARDIPSGAAPSATNVSGSITDDSGTAAYSADALATPGTSAPYVSALYNSPFSTRWYVLSFNTDSSLAAVPGWDNVTGVGAPNGAAFINAITQ